MEVLTPEQSILSQEVEEVVVPLSDGWLGILDGHAPFVGRITPGAVLLRNGPTRSTLATVGGTVAITNNLVTILTGAARLNCSFAELERALDDEARQLAAMETEAERHFDRVLRQATATLTRRRGREP